MKNKYKILINTMLYCTARIFYIIFYSKIRHFQKEIRLQRIYSSAEVVVES